MVILAIESSCDETAAAVLINGSLKSNIVATQAIHQQYGGVVPELASRAHQEAIIPVVEEALKAASVTKKDLSGIAVTAGPGLLGALLVGGCFAKGLAQSLKIPLVGVNHMQGHILAHFLTETPPPFPFICLTVSGGHTQLVQVNSPHDMVILGQTEDDAVGEAFDKVAKLLNLPYPGGPMVDKLASEGNPKAHKFPIGNRPGYNFSFSGIKTSVMYFLQKQSPEWIAANKADVCASVQYTLIETLMLKVHKAVEETGIRHLAIAGGVAANSGLRQRLAAYGAASQVAVYIPPLTLCTDNAAMIGIAGHFLLSEGIEHGQALRVNANMRF